MFACSRTGRARSPADPKPANTASGRVRGPAMPQSSTGAPPAEAEHGAIRKIAIPTKFGFGSRFFDLHSRTLRRSNGSLSRLSLRVRKAGPSP